MLGEFFLALIKGLQTLTHLDLVLEVLEEDVVLADLLEEADFLDVVEDLVEVLVEDLVEAEDSDELSALD